MEIAMPIGPESSGTTPMPIARSAHGTGAAPDRLLRKRVYKMMQAPILKRPVRTQPA